MKTDLNRIYTKTLPNGTEITILGRASSEDPEFGFEVVLLVDVEEFDDGLFESADEANECFDRGVEYFNSGEGDWVDCGSCGDTFF